MKNDQMLPVDGTELQTDRIRLKFTEQLEVNLASFQNH